VPVLDLLFARNGLANVFMPFKINQPVQTVPLGEPFDQPFPMFINAPDQVSGHAEIQEPFSRLVMK
jgi:hypothetical protein